MRKRRDDDNLPTPVAVGGTAESRRVAFWVGAMYSMLGSGASNAAGGFYGGGLV